jgi:hypothetical protein
MRGFATWLAVLLAAPQLVFADPASLDPDATPAGAEASFQAFARDWMARVRERGEREHDNPRLTPGAREIVGTYRETGPDFETQLQATGRPGTPYVGVLHYTENVYTCSDLRATDCRVVFALPVTEVFRLRDGRWVY